MMTGYPQQPQMYMQPGAPAVPARRRIRHVDVISAAKVVAVFQMVVWAVFGLFFGLCGGAFMSVLLGSINGLSGNRDTSVAGMGGIAGFLVTYLIGLVAAGIAGFIVGTLYAVVYNVTAGLTGGLEVDIA